MDLEELKRLGKDPKFIPGIHNYCDRWCERCSFTEKCMNFELSEKQYSTPESRDIENDAFWESLSDTFKLTLELVREMAKEQGIDLDKLDVDDTMEQEKLRDEQAEKHECTIAAKKYGKMVDKWFESAKENFEDKEKSLNKKLLLNIPGDTPEEEAKVIEDAVDVIMWYQHQIWVKLMRAVRGQMWEDEEDFDFPKDSDGSAKVVLIGLDRSIGAWGILLNSFPDDENNILNILVHLEKLRKSVEKHFPEARKFYRPGLDGPVEKE